MKRDSPSDMDSKQPAKPAALHNLTEPFRSDSAPSAETPKHSHSESSEEMPKKKRSKALSFGATALNSASVSISASNLPNSQMRAPGSGDATKAKHRKPKDMPRRPLSAYNVFFREERERIMAEREAGEDRLVEHKAEDSSRSNLRSSNIMFASIGKTIAQRWKTVNPEKLERYKQLAADDMERYRQEMNEYQFKLARDRLVQAGKQVQNEDAGAAILSTRDPTSQASSPFAFPSMTASTSGPSQALWASQQAHLRTAGASHDAERLAALEAVLALGPGPSPAALLGASSSEARNIEALLYAQAASRSQYDQLLGDLAGRQAFSQGIASSLSGLGAPAVADLLRAEHIQRLSSLSGQDLQLAALLQLQQQQQLMQQRQQQQNLALQASLPLRLELAGLQSSSDFSAGRSPSLLGGINMSLVQESLRRSGNQAHAMLGLQGESQNAVSAILLRQHQEEELLRLLLIQQQQQQQQQQGLLQTQSVSGGRAGDGDDDSAGS